MRSYVLNSHVYVNKLAHKGPWCISNFRDPWSITNFRVWIWSQGSLLQKTEATQEGLQESQYVLIETWSPHSPFLSIKLAFRDCFKLIRGKDFFRSTRNAQDTGDGFWELGHIDLVNPDPPRNWLPEVLSWRSWILYWAHLLKIIVVYYHCCTK